MGFAEALPYWKMLPFFLYIIIYIYITEATTRKHPEESLKTVFFKLLPVVSLIIMILSEKDKSAQHKSYKRLIIAGLFFSMAGDSCLVWRVKLFIPGLLFFAIAHVCYVLANGFKPFGSGATAVSCALIGCFTYAYLYPAISDPVMKYMVLLYSVLIFAMGWRTAARAQLHVNLGTMCGFLGALIFVISDFIIAFDKWKMKLDKASFWIMMTYYSAQLLISLSAACYVRTDAGIHATRKKTN